MRGQLWEALLLTAVGAGLGWPRLAGYLYLFQLDEYQVGRLRGTVRRRWRRLWRWEGLLLLGAAALALVAALVPGKLIALPLAAAALLLWPTRRPFASAGSLRWTPRARRLAAAAGVLLLALWLFALWFGWPGALALGLTDPLLVLALALATLGFWPYESWRRRAYMAEARAKLELVRPVVVGITGSYGKTTTKSFLRQLLDSPETPCFATPESFNTTLGVCLAINRGLEPNHRFAVIEMGAYRPGEIAEICSFTKPTLGIVTAVGPMHLERFGTRQRVAVAKSELLAALPAEGVAVLPSAIAERQTLTAPLRARAVWVGSPGDRWWAEEVEVGLEGTRLQLIGSAGERLELSVPVHGRHAVADLVLAFALAIELGVPAEQLLARAARLEGAPHRLQVSSSQGITIIDDAYNSNPEGAQEALRLLAALPGQRRVLVTPGFIELGGEQQQSMREFGRQAAAVCTHVILVGPRQSEPVRQGLAGAGFDPAQVTVVLNLAEAQLRLPQVAGRGSVVLFENDLPDQYRESA